MGIYDNIDAWLGGILPGGVTGRLPGGGASPFGGPTRLGPGGGVVPSGGSLPAITTTPETRTVLSAPPGYVIVEVDGRKIAMLKAVAYALGFKKRPRPRGGITGREIESARKVQRFLQSLTVNRQPRMKLKSGKRGR